MSSGSNVEYTESSMEFTTGFGIKDVVAWGNSGLVCLDAESNTVVKAPFSRDECLFHFEAERRIYERFKQKGGHSGLLRYYGQYEFGIRLEYAPNWDLLNFLQKHQEIETQQRLSWVQQVTDALCFIHACNVIHGDLTTRNILLTDTLEAKVADFGGSSIDGSDLLVGVNASHALPGFDSSTLSVQADLFALGSVLYTIMVGSCPYQDLLKEDKDHEIEALFAAGKFPETDSLGPIGAIITKCWHVQYDSAVSVRNDIEGIDTIKNACSITNDVKLSVNEGSLKLPPYSSPCSPFSCPSCFLRLESV